MPITQSSKLGIISAAFVRLGESPISSLGDPRVEAVVAEEFYDIVRKSNLENFRWSFSLRELAPAQLDLDSNNFEDEDFRDQYQHVYQKPNNSIRVIGLHSEIDFTTSLNYLWTDDPEPEILFLKDVDAPAFSAGFAFALSLTLSSHFAPAVTDKITLAEYWGSIADQEWAKARHNDSKTRTPLKLKYQKLLQRDSRTRPT